MGQMAVSIIVPVYNESESLPPLLEAIDAVVDSLPQPVEILLVDDGSTDGSCQVMFELRDRYDGRAIRVIALDGNHGLTTAMAAGFSAARGDVIVTLDADLQNDPGDIPGLVRCLDECDVAIGWRKDRRDPLVKRVSSRIANWVRNKLTGDDVKDTGCSLKAYKREYVSKLKLYDGLHRFLPTLLKMEGATVVQVPVKHHPRRFGRSKYGLFNRLIRPFCDLLAVRWMRKRHLKYKMEEK